MKKMILFLFMLIFILYLILPRIDTEVTGNNLDKDVNANVYTYTEVESVDKWSKP